MKNHKNETLLGFDKFFRVKSKKRVSNQLKDLFWRISPLKRTTVLTLKGLFRVYFSSPYKI